VQYYNIYRKVRKNYKNKYYCHHLLGIKNNNTEGVFLIDTFLNFYLPVLSRIKISNKALNSKRKCYKLQNDIAAMYGLEAF